MLSVTVDTNVLDAEKVDRIADAVVGLDVDIRTTTVTHRELPVMRVELPHSPLAETGVYDESEYDRAIYEPGFIDESEIGRSMIVDDVGEARFESILKVLASGSFPRPGDRGRLTIGQRRQLRDAMILEAHARERRDIFVSDDRTAFIGPDGEKRRRLEALCETRILTVDEFCEYAVALR